MYDKNVLVVCTVAGFLNFEMNDMKILKNMGFQVYVATNFVGYEGIESVLEEKGILRYQVDFARSPLKSTNVRAYRQLQRIMKEMDFRLVHCHTPVGGVLARLAAKKYRKQGTKVIYTAHGFHFFKGAPLINWLVFYPIEKYLSRWTDVLITINQEDYKRAKDRFHAKRVEYIPGVGVDITRYSACHVDTERKRKEIGVPSDGFILLSVGELNSNKNQTLIINALHKLNNKHIFYLCAGTGKLKEKYKKLIKEYHLEEHIKLLGYRHDIGELCKAADCFVHPSFREGLAIAPLEAMACGLPLIASNIRGIRDYAVDGISGYCVNPGSCGEMASAINKMYEQDDFRKKCSANNTRAVKKFDIAQIGKNMNGMYCGILQDKKAGKQGEDT